MGRQVQPNQPAERAGVRRMGRQRARRKAQAQQWESQVCAKGPLCSARREPAHRGLCSLPRRSPVEGILPLTHVPVDVMCT